MEIRYDEYDEDIAENQLLLAATLILLESAVVPPRLQTKLARLRRALAAPTSQPWRRTLARENEIERSLPLGIAAGGAAPFLVPEAWSASPRTSRRPSSP